jgi:hypothetical protein
MASDFATLDEVLRTSFPVESTRVVAVREHGNAAVALFDTRPSAEPYLYEVSYYRKNGRWTEGSSSNGMGWNRYSYDADLGVETLWGQAPPDADLVRAEREGRLLEEPVASGFYLLVWWDVPDRAAELKAFRVKGEWVRARTVWEEFLAQREAWLRARGS